MRRAVLRGRSGDIVTAVQLADRTGIVAASAPPVDSVSPAARHLVLVDGEVVPEAGARHFPLIHLDEAAARRSLEGRARRRVLFTGAAAMCLALGWIGGGAFGYRHVEQTAPTVAVGVANQQDQPQASVQGPAQAPVTTTTVPKPPVAVTTPPPKPRNNETVGSTRRSSAPRTSSTPLPSSQSRAPLLGTVARTEGDTMRAAFDQFQRLVNSWSFRR